MQYCEDLLCWNQKPCSTRAEAAARRVVVLGATGNQGSSVIKVLAKNKSKNYQIVGVTRDANSKAAQALKQDVAGLEIVEADNDDKESLVRAFRNAWAVFAFTVSDYTSNTHEYEQGKRIADAAEEAKVQFVLCSTVPHAFQVSGMKVPGFDTKAEIDIYMRTKSFKTISLIAVSFFENLLSILKPYPHPSDPNKFIISSPTKPETALPYFSAGDDTGKFFDYALETAEANAGKTIVMAGDYLSGDDLATRMGKFFGRQIEFKQQTETEFRSHVPFAKVADALLAMFRFYDQYGYGCGGPEIVERERGSKLEDWLSRHKNEAAFDVLRK